MVSGVNAGACAFRWSRATESAAISDRLADYCDFWMRCTVVELLPYRVSDIHRQRLAVDKTARSEIKGHQPAVLWFTGLSGSGKSTIANIVEQELHHEGVHTYMLDCDNIRLGLNRDLGFTPVDRAENIRRVGEVARLFVDAGLIVLCAIISPFRRQRQLVRNLFSADDRDLRRYADASRDALGLSGRPERTRNAGSIGRLVTGGGEGG